MSVGPRQFGIFVEQILVELRSLQEQISAVRDAAKASVEAKRQIPEQLSFLRVPENEKTANKAYQDKAHRQQVILTWVTGGAFLAAAIYAGVAASQLSEMRRSNETARHQVTEAENTLDTAMSQFDRTMTQMQAQTTAQQKAAKASWAAANDMRDQISAANKANSIAQEALETQTRPWVGIDGDITPIPDSQMLESSTTPIPNPPDGPIGERIGIKYKMRNYGYSMATQIAPTFILWSGKPNDRAFDVARLCDSSDNHSRSNLRNLISIFPQNTSDAREGTVTSCYTALRDNGSRADVCSAAGIANYLATCISYQSQGTIIYRTRALYSIERSDELIENPLNRQLRKITSFNLVYSGAEIVQQTKSK
jgi:hypothetical protein